MSQQKNKYIYVLALKEGKFFIGVSKDPKYRLHEHKKGRGGTFTKKYKPIKIEEQRLFWYPDAVETIALEYIKLYGPCNVKCPKFPKFTL